MNPFKMFFDRPLVNTIKAVIGISVATLWTDASVHKENSILATLFADIEQTRHDRAMEKVVDLWAENQDQGETE